VCPLARNPGISQSSPVREADVHVSHCQAESRVFWARSGERAGAQVQDLQLARYASRHRFLHSAEPDIHLLSRALKAVTED
jgi:hypothetical protein